MIIKLIHETAILVKKNFVNLLKFSLLYITKF